MKWQCQKYSGNKIGLLEIKSKIAGVEERCRYLSDAEQKKKKQRWEILKEQSRKFKIQILGVAERESSPEEITKEIIQQNFLSLKDFRPSLDVQLNR